MLTSHSAAFHVVYIIFTLVWVFTPLKRGVGSITTMAPTHANYLDYSIRQKNLWSVLEKAARSLLAQSTQQSENRSVTGPTEEKSQHDLRFSARSPRASEGPPDREIISYDWRITGGVAQCYTGDTTVHAFIFITPPPTLFSLLKGESMPHLGPRGKRWGGKWPM